MNQDVAYKHTYMNLRFLLKPNFFTSHISVLLYIKKSRDQFASLLRDSNVGNKKLRTSSSSVSEKLHKLASAAMHRHVR